MAKFFPKRTKTKPKTVRNLPCLNEGDTKYNVQALL